MKKLLMLAVAVGIVATTFTGVASALVYADSAGTLKLAPCKYTYGLTDPKQTEDAQCGVLQVPQDRSNPTGTKINLQVTILSAKQAKDKELPIFHLEGGPGGSAITNWGKVWYTAYRQLREHHDVVLIDQRGIGQSTSLQCTEISDASVTDLEQAYTPDQDRKLTADRIKQCLTRLSRTVDPAFFTSTIMADDTDDVRAALGFDQIDIFGNSYGTWLGQIYLGRHGDHVHAIVLDSVVGPWNDYLLDAANNADAALARIFDLCRQDAQCASIYPDSRGQLQTLLKTLEVKPVTVGSEATPVVITAGRLLGAIRQMMYQADFIGVIPSEIDKASKGDLKTFANVLMQVAKASPEVSIGLYYSVNCSESLPFYTPDLIKKFQKGAFFGADKDSIAELSEICGLWRSAEVSAADVAPVKSDRPTLILSGGFDPVTPISYGQEAHKRLTNSTLAIFPYHAHGPMATSKCAQNMVVAFFDAPDKPVDTSCTARDIQPIFVGAYNVSLVPYSDPEGVFSAQIPSGWEADAKTSTGQITFFNSPDKVQLLGLGVIKNLAFDKARDLAIAQITKAYGAVDIQFNMNVLTIGAIQHTLDRPSELYTGILFLRRVGQDTYITWQAAPNNIIQAVTLPISLPVMLSMRAGR